MLHERKRDGNFTKDRKFHGESNVWSTIKRFKKVKDLMLMLCLNEIIDQLAIANSVCWYGHMLRREDGHVLRRTLDLEVEGERKKRRPKRTWKKHVEEESLNVGLRREDAFC